MRGGKIKKTIKLLCIAFSAILMLNSCSQQTNSRQTQVWVAEKPEFVIEDAEYTIKIEITDGLDEYIFVLTRENILLSQFRDLPFDELNLNAYWVLATKDKEFYEENMYFEQAKTTLTDYQTELVDTHLEKAIYDIPLCANKGHVCSIKDYWQPYGYHVTIFSHTDHTQDSSATFCYGAAKSPSVNMLIEVLIGCSNFERNVTDSLIPIGEHKRKMAQRGIEKNQNKE